MRVTVELAVEDRNALNGLSNALLLRRPLLDPLQLVVCGAVIGALVMFYVMSGSDGKGRR